MTRPGELIEETRRIYESAMAMRTTVSTDMNDVFMRLMEGPVNIPLEVPWDERREDETLDRHQIVLLRLDPAENRIFFFNPASRHGPAGTPLGGPGQGPIRRAEGEGQESIALSEFAAFFAGGGAYALLTS